MKAAEPPTPLTEADAWTNAKSLVDSFGKYFNLFTTAIRSLRSQGDVSPSRGLDATSKFNLLRLLASPSLKAKIYFAGKTFYPDKVPPRTKSEDLISIFTPNELGSLLTIIVLYQMAQKICEEEYWPRISDRINLFAEGGMYLGMAMPAIGPSTGLMVGTLRYISFAAFQKSNPNRYSTYNRDVRGKGATYDLEMEKLYWGTTHVHAGSVLLQQMGFGKEFSQDYFFGLIEEVPMERSHRAKLMKAAVLWLDSLLLKGEAPESEEADEINIEDEDADLLLTRLEKLKRSGSSYNWLSKTGDDLPQFKEGEKETGSDSINTFFSES